MQTDRQENDTTMKDVKLTSNDGNNINKVEVQAKAATVVLQRNGQQKDMEAQTKGKTTRNEAAKQKTAMRAPQQPQAGTTRPRRNQATLSPCPSPTPMDPIPTPARPLNYSGSIA